MTAIAVVAPCRGAPAPQRDPRDVEAKKKCLAGDPNGGVALLVELYVETGNTTYLYNQARCFQQNGRPEEAIQRFREYLRKTADVTAQERAQVDAYIAELEAEREAGTRAAAPAPPVLEARPPPAEVATAPLESERGRRPLRIATFALGVAGVALVGTGVYFGLRVRALEKSAEQRAHDDRIIDRDEQARGEAAARWQWVGYGLGAAALAGGVTTYLLSRRQEERVQSAVTVTPVVSPALAGGRLRLTF
jgi:hypothetical protein